MTTSSISSTTGSTSSTVSTDVYNRVQQTMASQTTAANKLNATLTKDQTKLSSLGQLQSALATFQTSMASFVGDGLSTSAASSDKTVLTATSTGTAKSGTYAIDVKQLAQGQFLTSGSFPASNTAVGSGTTATVKIDFGTAGADGFVVNGTSTSKTLTIDSSNNTLDGIAAALKTAGVDASVVKGSDGQYSLSIAGADGAANSMRISVSGDAALKNVLGYDPDGTQNMKQTTAAQDAILTVGDKTITSASNTVKDSAIDGATLTLAAAGKSDITITQDASQIGDNLKAFVSAYNDLNTKLLKLQSGSLGDDTALKQAVNQMSLLVKTGGGASVTALAAAGVSQDKDGNLVLDDSKLQAALSKDSSAVAKLFTNDGKGLADVLSTKAAALTGTSSQLTKETAQTTKEISTLTTKKTAMTEAMTAQATALASLYTSESAAGTGSLFDWFG